MRRTVVAFLVSAGVGVVLLGMIVVAEIDYGWSATFATVAGLVSGFVAATVFNALYRERTHE